MTSIVRNMILGASTLWGIAYFVLGILASFTIGSKDTLASVTGFVLIFILPIVASVTARWAPVGTGFALLAAVIFVLTAVAHDIMILLCFHVLFAVMFLAMAKGSDRAAAMKRMATFWKVAPPEEPNPGTDDESGDHESGNP